jgi:hypothetical protein
MRLNHVTWSAELRFHGESYGWEAMLLRRGELFASRRFIEKRQAAQWAEDDRKELEKDSTDGATARLKAFTPAVARPTS